MKNIDKSFAAEIMVTIGTILALMIAVIALSIIAIPIHALILKYAWNYVMPTLFKLPKIGFWQALALVFITRILIKSSNSNTNHDSKN